jgi:DNA-binding transcriptional LysR family regulator
MLHDEYEAFLCVVEQQSMNKAAQYLHISQPALSRKIQKLEQQLNVQLFVRSGKKLLLTRLGQICYEQMKVLQAGEQQFLQEIRSYREERHSQLTIGASLTTLQATLPNLITAFNQVHADHEMKVVTGKTHEIVALVQDKKVDIGLIATTIDHPGMQCVPLFADHLELVVPVHHPFTVQPPMISDLNRLPMILFSSGSLYRVLMDELFQRYGIYPQVKMEIDSFEAMIRLVSTFRVATLLPKSYLHQAMLDNNGLTIIELPELTRTIRETSIIYPDERHLNQASRQFVAIARATFHAS